MIYIIVAVLSIILWFVFIGCAKLIDLSNKNKDWYKDIQRKLTEEQ